MVCKLMDTCLAERQARLMVQLQELSHGTTSEKVMFLCPVLGNERLKGSWKNLC